MNKISRVALKSVVIAIGGLLSLPALATKSATFTGAVCGFADNPLASHNRIHHRFKNTSGSSQWITCPIPRTQVGSRIEDLTMEIFGTASNVRFEKRDALLGSLMGWDAAGSQILTGGNRYYWFDHELGVAEGSEAFAYEAKLSNNSYVSHLEIWEED